jgi:hypothetical protein
LKLALFTFLLAIVGLWFYFVSKTGRRFRAVGLLYVIPLIIFLVAKGRGYYLAPGYPLLYAGGAVSRAETTGRLRPLWRLSLEWFAWASVVQPS